MQETTGNWDGLRRGTKRGRLTTLKIMFKTTACRLQPQQKDWNLSSKPGMLPQSERLRQSQLSYVIEAQLESLLSVIKFWITEVEGKVGLNDPAARGVVAFSLSLLFNLGSSGLEEPVFICSIDWCILCSIKLENNVKWMRRVRILTAAEATHLMMPQNMRDARFGCHVLLLESENVPICWSQDWVLLGEPFLIPAGFQVAHLVTLQKEKLLFSIWLAFCVLY